MFRSMFRVVLVAVVVLGLAGLVVPNANAAPNGAKAPVVKAGDGWVQSAVAWLTSWVVRKPAPKKNGPVSVQTQSESAATNGPCIDPWGPKCP